ncbi:hypothetical protein QMK19_39780 [Streptomyces sp. H10-C2]|uniref:hypothetical protein n=1 Tax=unclassified Streptomyces TaxID=2593676 RepID=UPI0024BA7727|nr:MULTISPECIES: hypothetical protein [unclassified Streptomyces]MDJ0347354.1 hypothetical protein [Streptomyces sp. PH10-H1]MDJ0375564.1 hypothetical protein [Streptomyces sp. H10-C2]
MSVPEPPSLAPELTTAQLATVRRAAQEFARVLERTAHVVAPPPDSEPAEGASSAQVLTRFEWSIDTVAAALFEVYALAVALDPTLVPRVRWTPTPSSTSAAQ